MSESISSSDLKQIIVIESLQSSKNQYGILIESWNEILNTRAKVVNTGGSESNENQGIQNKVEIEVFIRFHRSIKNKDRIKFNGEYFNITYINNLDNKNKWLSLKGVKVD